MTEPSNEPVGQPGGDVQEPILVPLPGAQAEPVTEPVGDVGGTPEPETYPKSVVDKLREENAAARVAAKDAEKVRERLMAASIEAATAGILFDPTDLPTSDDFFGEDGLPDLHKIREAAEELANVKPHLSRARGSAGQGARPKPEEAFSLAGMLRAAAR